MTRFFVGSEERVAVVQARGQDRTRVVVDGTALDLEVTRLGPGAFVWRGADGSVEIFYCVRDGRVVHLAWRGATYRIEEREEGASTHTRPTHGALEAPMPGKVMAVRVGVGQRVAKGAEVLVVEAMKMENAIRAPHDGVVKGVFVKEGDAVVPGVVLVELE
jgi:acetyl/propionyl-CoA carboxylase alpha subunit